MGVWCLVRMFRRQVRLGSVLSRASCGWALRWTCEIGIAKVDNESRSRDVSDSEIDYLQVCQMHKEAYAAFLARFNS